NLALLARIISSENLGLYSTAWTSLNVFLTFSLFGVHTATAKIISESRVRSKELIGKICFNALILAALLGVILFACSLFIAPLIESFVRTPGFGVVFRIIGWNIPLLNTLMVAQAVLQGMQEFSWYSVIVAVPGLLAIPLTYSFAVVA